MRVLVFDRLDMLVTCEPAAEIDGALAQAAARLHDARTTGDSRVADRLAAWIDHRLDERCELSNSLVPDIGRACRPGDMA